MLVGSSRRKLNVSVKWDGAIVFCGVNLKTANSLSDQNLYST